MSCRNTSTPIRDSIQATLARSIPGVCAPFRRPFPCHHQERRVTNQVEQIIRPATRLPGRPMVQIWSPFVLPSEGPSLAGPFRGASIHRRIFDHGSPSLSNTLPPFPMWPALLASEYYDGSAPSAAFSRQRTYPRKGAARGRFPCSLSFGPRVRHPALPLRHRRGYAVDPHHDLPGPAHLTDPTVPHQPQPRGLQPDRQVCTALQPRSAGFELVDDKEA